MFSIQKWVETRLLKYRSCTTLFALRQKEKLSSVGATSSA